MAARGFTLVEMMVALFIVTLLLLLVIPAYSEFAANSKARHVTESALYGLRQAQLEAVKANALVRFRVTSTGWEVRDVDTDTVLRSEVLPETGSGNAPTLVVEPAGASEVTFTGLGRVAEKNPPVPPSTASTDPIVKIKVSPPSPVGTRALGVSISALGGSVKMCDPDSKFTYSGSKDPMACPYPW